MRKRSGQVHSRESSATLQLTVSLLYRLSIFCWCVDMLCDIIYKRNLQIDTCRWGVITMKEYQHLIGKIIVAVAIIVAANIIAQAIGGAGESIRSGLFQLGDALR